MHQLFSTFVETWYDLHDNVYSCGLTGGDSSVEDGGELQQVRPT